MPGPTPPRRAASAGGAAGNLFFSAADRAGKLLPVEAVLSRPDPRDAQAVWLVPPGREVRPRLRYLVLAAILLVPMTLTATLGSINFSSPDGTAIASFWPAAAFQIVFSIWFGVYGALVGTIGPMLGNGLIGESAWLYVPANALQSCLAGLWFRWRKLDPRLRSQRDWSELIIVGVLAGNALGALAGVGESSLRGLAGPGFWGVNFLRWFSANSLPCLLLVPLMLKTASPMIVREPFFCQRFWGGVEPARGRAMWRRLAHLPMMAKLMLLTLVAGILPLSVVAGWSVWSTVKRADRMAAETNRDVALQIRNEIERDEQMLSIWAVELSRPGLTDQDRQQLLELWRAIPETFHDLRIADRASVEAGVPAEIRGRLGALPLWFYQAPGQGGAGGRALRVVARLGYAPEKVLTGLVVWRSERPLTGQWADHEAILVLDKFGDEVYRHTPRALADWRPAAQERPNQAYTVRHGGQRWHVAEAMLPRTGCRFVSLSSARSAQAVALARMANPLAVLINLAIFGSLIAGSAFARRISGRVLAIAEHVRETGAQPGKLQLPVTGHDELGYLAETLNRMSRDLAEHVRRLQETTAEKERLAAEMELARQVQRNILPAEPPQVPGYELAGASYPAREVGGDFFDYFDGADGRVVLMIGDAVGKGLKAAMFITETHGLARAAVMDRPTPERILQAVNSAMASAREAPSDFVTMLCGVLEPQQHRLLYASAGHDPPILLRDGQTQSLQLGSLPLAVSPETDYQLHELALAPGDTVIMYTDGATEVTNSGDEPFGVEQLRAAASRHAGAPAGELLDALLGAVRDFAGAVPQSDDVTLLVLRRCKEEPPTE